MDTLGDLLALKVTAASEQERAQVADLLAVVPEVTDEKVEAPFSIKVIPDKSRPRKPLNATCDSSWSKPAEAKRGFVLLPQRWVGERSFAWAARFRRLAKDYERRPPSLAGLHWLAFLALMLNSLFHQCS